VKEIYMPTQKKTSDSDPNVTEVSDDTASVQSAVSSTENPAADATIVSGQSVSELANHVLHGRFGDFNVVRSNLDKAGVDSSAVLAEVNQRLSRGAPASYRPNISQVLDSARRGEWGSNNIALRIRGAGFSETDALHVESALNQES
jgi:hypothetical protein